MKDNTKYSLSDIREKLNQVGLKATHQRLVIYEALCKLMRHPSAEEIFELVKSKNPSISLGTVYKTLDSFVETGLLHKVSTRQGTMRYDVNVTPHHHLYCTNTHEIYDFQDGDLQELIQKFLTSKNFSNFEVEDIRLHINGKKIDKRKNITIQ